jgi:hypothetical protein
MFKFCPIIGAPDIGAPIVAAAGFFGMAVNAVDWAKLLAFGVLSLIIIVGLISALFARSLPKIVGVIIMGAIALTVAFNLLQLKDIGSRTLDELQTRPPAGSSNVIGR